MTLRHYRIFLTVCEKQNMTQAAAELFISQSAVSQSIAELERHYGFPLFDRLAGKLQITENGRKLMHYTEEILALGEQIEREMRVSQREPRLKVATVPNLGRDWLPDLVAGFRAAHPTARPVMYSMQADALDERLERGWLDLGVSDVQPKTPEQFSERILFREPLVFAAREDLLPAGADGEVLSVRTFSSLPVLLRERRSTALTTLGNQLERLGIRMIVNGVFSDAGGIRAAALRGLGVGLLPRSAVRPGDALRLFSLQELPMERTVRLLWHKDKLVTREMRDFLDYTTARYTGPVPEE